MLCLIYLDDIRVTKHWEGFPFLPRNLEYMPLKQDLQENYICEAKSVMKVLGGKDQAVNQGCDGARLRLFPRLLI